MDYHSLPRKQLQALCKKHEIPANSTNAQMADALAALLNVVEKPGTGGPCKGGKGQQKLGSADEDDGVESVVTEVSDVPRITTRSKKQASKADEIHEELGSTDGDADGGVTDAKSRTRRAKSGKENASKAKEGHEVMEETERVPVHRGGKPTKTTVKFNIEEIDTLEEEKNDSDNEVAEGARISTRSKKHTRKADEEVGLTDGDGEEGVTDAKSRTRRTRLGKENASKTEEGDEGTKGTDTAPSHKGGKSTSKTTVKFNTEEYTLEEEKNGSDNEVAERTRISTRSKNHARKVNEIHEELGQSTDGDAGGGLTDAKSRTRRTKLVKENASKTDGAAEAMEEMGRTCLRRAGKPTKKTTAELNTGELDKSEKGKNDSDEVADDIHQKLVRVEQNMNSETKENEGPGAPRLNLRESRKKTASEAKVTEVTPEVRRTRTRASKMTQATLDSHPVSTGLSARNTDGEGTVKKTPATSSKPTSENKARNPKGAAKSPIVIDLLDDDEGDEPVMNAVAVPSKKIYTAKPKKEAEKTMPAQRALRGQQMHTCVEAAVKPPEPLKGVVTRKGRNGGLKTESVPSTDAKEGKAVNAEEEVLNTCDEKWEQSSSEVDDSDVKEAEKTMPAKRSLRNQQMHTCVEAAVKPPETLKGVVTRKGRNGGLKAESVPSTNAKGGKTVNAEEEVLRTCDEKREQSSSEVGDSDVEEAEKTMPAKRTLRGQQMHTCVEAAVKPLEPLKGMVTRKGRNGGGLKTESVPRTNAKEGKAVNAEEEVLSTCDEKREQSSSEADDSDVKETEKTMPAKRALRGQQIPTGVESAVKPTEPLKRVGTRKGRNGRHKIESVPSTNGKEDKVVNAEEEVLSTCDEKQQQSSSEVDDSDVKEKLTGVRNFTRKMNSSKVQGHQMNICVEAAVKPSESLKGVATRGHQYGGPQTELVPNNNADVDKAIHAEEAAINACDEKQELSSPEADDSDVKENVIGHRKLTRKTDYSKPKTQRSCRKQDSVENEDHMKNRRQISSLSYHHPRGKPHGTATRKMTCPGDSESSDREAVEGVQLISVPNEDSGHVEPLCKSQVNEENCGESNRTKKPQIEAKKVNPVEIPICKNSKPSTRNGQKQKVQPSTRGSHHANKGNEQKQEVPTKQCYKDLSALTNGGIPLDIKLGSAEGFSEGTAAGCEEIDGRELIQNGNVHCGVSAAQPSKSGSCHAKKGECEGTVAGFISKEEKARLEPKKASVVEALICKNTKPCTRNNKQQKVQPSARGSRQGKKEDERKEEMTTKPSKENLVAPTDAHDVKLGNAGSFNEDMAVEEVGKEVPADEEGAPKEIKFGETDGGSLLQTVPKEHKGEDHQPGICIRDACVVEASGAEPKEEYAICENNKHLKKSTKKQQTHSVSRGNRYLRMGYRQKVGKVELTTDVETTHESLCGNVLCMDKATETGLGRRGKEEPVAGAVEEIDYEETNLGSRVQNKPDPSQELTETLGLFPSHGSTGAENSSIELKDNMEEDPTFKDSKAVKKSSKMKQIQPRGNCSLRTMNERVCKLDVSTEKANENVAIYEKEQKISNQKAHAEEANTHESKLEDAASLYKGNESLVIHGKEQQMSNKVAPTDEGTTTYQSEHGDALCLDKNSGTELILTNNNLRLMLVDDSTTEKQQNQLATDTYSTGHQVERFCNGLELIEQLGKEKNCDSKLLLLVEPDSHETIEEGNQGLEKANTVEDRLGVLHPDFAATVAVENPCLEVHETIEEKLQLSHAELQADSSFIKEVAEEDKLSDLIAQAAQECSVEEKISVSNVGLQINYLHANDVHEDKSSDPDSRKESGMGENIVVPIMTPKNGILGEKDEAHKDGLNDSDSNKKSGDSSILSDEVSKNLEGQIELVCNNEAEDAGESIFQKNLGSKENECSHTFSSAISLKRKGELEHVSCNKVLKAEECSAGEEVLVSNVDLPNDNSLVENEAHESETSDSGSIREEDQIGQICDEAQDPEIAFRDGSRENNNSHLISDAISLKGDQVECVSRNEAPENEECNVEEEIQCSNAGKGDLGQVSCNEVLEAEECGAWEEILDSNVELPNDNSLLEDEGHESETSDSKSIEEEDQIGQICDEAQDPEIGFLDDSRENNDSHLISDATSLKEDQVEWVSHNEAPENEECNVEEEIQFSNAGKGDFGQVSCNEVLEAEECGAGEEILDSNVELPNENSLSEDEGHESETSDSESIEEEDQIGQICDEAQDPEIGFLDGCRENNDSHLISDAISLKEDQVEWVSHNEAPENEECNVEEEIQFSNAGKGDLGQVSCNEVLEAEEHGAGEEILDSNVELPNGNSLLEDKGHASETSDSESIEEVDRIGQIRKDEVPDPESNFLDGKSENDDSHMACDAISLKEDQVEWVSHNEAPENEECNVEQGIQFSNAGKGALEQVSHNEVLETEECGAEEEILNSNVELPNDNSLVENEAHGSETSDSESIEEVDRIGQICKDEAQDPESNFLDGKRENDDSHMISDAISLKEDQVEWVSHNEAPENKECNVEEGIQFSNAGKGELEQVSWNEVLEAEECGSGEVTLDSNIGKGELEHVSCNKVLKAEECGAGEEILVSNVELPNDNSLVENEAHESETSDSGSIGEGDQIGQICKDEVQDPEITSLDGGRENNDSHLISDAISLKEDQVEWVSQNEAPENEECNVEEEIQFSNEGKGDLDQVYCNEVLEAEECGAGEEILDSNVELPNDNSLIGKGELEHASCNTVLKAEECGAGEEILVSNVELPNDNSLVESEAHENEEVDRIGQIFKDEVQDPESTFLDGSMENDESQLNSGAISPKEDQVEWISHIEAPENEECNVEEESQFSNAGLQNYNSPAKDEAPENETHGSDSNKGLDGFTIDILPDKISQKEEDQTGIASAADSSEVFDGFNIIFNTIPQRDEDQIEQVCQDEAENVELDEYQLDESNDFDSTEQNDGSHVNEIEQVSKHENSDAESLLAKNLSEEGLLESVSCDVARDGEESKVELYDDSSDIGGIGEEFNALDILSDAISPKEEVQSEQVSRNEAFDVEQSIIQKYLEVLIRGEKIPVEVSGDLDSGEEQHDGLIALPDAICGKEEDFLEHSLQNGAGDTIKSAVGVYDVAWSESEHIGKSADCKVDEALVDLMHDSDRTEREASEERLYSAFDGEEKDRELIEVNMDEKRTRDLNSSEDDLSETGLAKSKDIGKILDLKVEISTADVMHACDEPESKASPERLYVPFYGQENEVEQTQGTLDKEGPRDSDGSADDWREPGLAKSQDARKLFDCKVEDYVADVILSINQVDNLFKDEAAAREENSFSPGVRGMYLAEARSKTGVQVSMDNSEARNGPLEDFTSPGNSLCQTHVDRCVDQPVIGDAELSFPNQLPEEGSPPFDGNFDEKTSSIEVNINADNYSPLEEGLLGSDGQMSNLADDMSRKVENNYKFSEQICFPTICLRGLCGEDGKDDGGVEQPDESTSYTATEDSILEQSQLGISSERLVSFSEVACCLGIDNSLLEQRREVVATDFDGEQKLPKLETPLKKFGLTESSDVNPESYSSFGACNNEGSREQWMFPNEGALCSGIENSILYQSHEFLPTDLGGEKEVLKLDTPLKKPELIDSNDMSPGLSILFGEACNNEATSEQCMLSGQVVRCSVIDNFMPEQTQEVLPTDLYCGQELSQLNTPSLKKPELIDSNDMSPGLSILFGEACNNEATNEQCILSGQVVRGCSVIDNFMPEQTQEVLPTDLYCEQELSQLNTPSLKKPEVAKSNGGMSPALSSLVGEALNNRASGEQCMLSGQVAPYSGTDNIPLEQIQELLPPTGLYHDQVCTPWKKLELPKNNSMSSCLSTLLGDTHNDGATSEWVQSGEDRDEENTGISDTLQAETNTQEKLQLNLQALTQEKSYATPGRKFLHPKVIASAKKHRHTIFESNEAMHGSMKENTPKLTKLSLRKLRELYKEAQTKDPEKVGKRSALRNLSSNLPDQRMESVGYNQPFPEDTAKP